MVGLESKADTFIEKLSGGQKQRFSIVASLVNDPELVFLDEPTTGLGPLARRNLWKLITQINNQGKTIVLTTHYLEEAETLCDRIIISHHFCCRRNGNRDNYTDDVFRRSVFSNRPVACLALFNCQISAFVSPFKNPQASWS